VYGTATTLASGLATVTLSLGATFSSASSYVCTAIDTQSRLAVLVVNNDGTNFTLSSYPNDIISYICVGS